VWLTAAVVMGVALLAAMAAIAGTLHHVYFNRERLPDMGPFTRFEFPAIGHVYDINGEPLVELAREHRRITQFADIPPVVRDAILATEDKRFFVHNGVDYRSMLRIVGKVRFGAWGTRLLTGGSRDNTPGRAIFPQGASTITQQLVRGVFLQRQTSQENSYQLRDSGLAPRMLSSAIGARNVNMVLRKLEEIRLSLWVEDQMREQFGSTRRAKEEIFARYASFVYMGNGQYGFARASEYYFGRALSTFTEDDVDKAATLASIAKSPRDYAPTARNVVPALRRRNETLALMAEGGYLSSEQSIVVSQRPLAPLAPRVAPGSQSSAAVAHVLRDLTAAHPELGIEDLLQGRIQVTSTIDARLQRIASEALQHGLDQYERRHARAQGMTQGSVVVLKNADGSILAEVGGREVYRGRPSSYSDFNRVTESLRQPGSAMKPIVYLAAFRTGNFTLDTVVPDEPVSVPDGRPDVMKWISNYDGRFKGMIPVREALAESRNAVAVWIIGRIGIDATLAAARSVGVQTPLHPYATTALGASEVNLLELANAYRTIASAIVATPHVIQRISTASAEAIDTKPGRRAPVPLTDPALVLIQEGLRGVVRIPAGTAHALDGPRFPIAVMGKTGTTNDFRDALFVGSTYGAAGITVAVRIGFDDNRSLGPRETGGLVALPVFQQLMLRVYRDGIVGPAPKFPNQMEQRITSYLQGDTPVAPTDSVPVAAAVAQAVVPVPPVMTASVPLPPPR
jgi:penicillin-binding protein 1A